MSEERTMSEAADTPDQGAPDEGAPSEGAAGKPADRATGAQTAPGAAEMLQDLRARHRTPPGIIRTDRAVGLARRVERLAAGRLSLLDDLQRRWATGNDFPGGDVAFVHAGQAARQATPGGSPWVEGRDLTPAGGMPGTPDARVVVPPVAHAPGAPTPAAAAASVGGRGPDAVGPQAVHPSEPAVARAPAGKPPAGKVGAPRTGPPRTGAPHTVARSASPSRATEGEVATGAAPGSGAGEQAAMGESHDRAGRSVPATLPADRGGAPPAVTLQRSLAESPAGPPEPLAQRRSARAHPVDTPGASPSEAAAGAAPAATPAALPPGPDREDARTARTADAEAGATVSSIRNAAPSAVMRTAAVTTADGEGRATGEQAAIGEGHDKAGQSVPAVLPVDRSGAPPAVTLRRSLAESPEPLPGRRSARAHRAGIPDASPPEAPAEAAPAAALPPGPGREAARTAQTADREAAATVSAIPDAAPPAMIRAAAVTTTGEGRGAGEEARPGSPTRPDRARPVGVVGEPLVVRRMSGPAAAGGGQGITGSLPAKTETWPAETAGRRGPLGGAASGPAGSTVGGPAGEASEPAAEERSMRQSPTGSAGAPVAAAMAAVPAQDVVPTGAGRPDHLSRTADRPGAPLVPLARGEGQTFESSPATGIVQRRARRQAEQPGQAPAPQSALTVRPAAGVSGAGTSLPVRRVAAGVEPHGTLQAALAPVTVRAVGHGPSVGAASSLPAPGADRSPDPTAPQRGETRGRPVVYPQSLLPAAPPAVLLAKTVQRAPAEPESEVAGASSADAASAAAGQTASSSTASSAGPGPAADTAAGKPNVLKLEGPDLERVANEVYAIIERRLQIERESLGL
jgi:hypothetical protein